MVFSVILCAKIMPDLVNIVTIIHACNLQSKNGHIKALLIASIGVHSETVFGHSSPSDVVHRRLWAQSTVALDHLQDEKVTVSETDKEVWIAGWRVHAL